MTIASFLKHSSAKGSLLCFVMLLLVSGCMSESEKPDFGMVFVKQIASIPESLSPFTVPLLIATMLSCIMSSRKFIKQEAIRYQHLGFTKSIINLVRLIIGSAFASLPISIYKCGMRVGFLLLILSAISSFGGLYFYEETIRLSNIKSEDMHIQKVERLTSKIKFSKIISLVHEIMIAFKAIGVTTAYMASMAELFGDSISVTGPESGIQLFLIITLSILVYFFADRYLDLYLSSSFFILMVISVYWLLPSKQTNSNVTQVRNSEIDSNISNSSFNYLIQNSKLYLNQFSLFIFAFTCHHNVFKIHNSAKKDIIPIIPWVLALGVGCVFIYYAVISYVICTTYHDKLSENSNIPNSFALAPDGFLSSACRLLYAFFILISYPAHANSFADATSNIEILIQGSTSDKQFIDRWRWNAITGLILGNAAIVFFLEPNYVEIMKRVGSMVSTFICFIFPSIYYLMYPSPEKQLIKRIGASILLVLGIVVLLGYLKL